jgi:propionyl-CoA synthetase
MNYSDIYRSSIEDPEGFWSEQARALHWHQAWNQVFDGSRPPFSRWFVGGKTNLCFNALDRHLPERGEQPALQIISTETGEANAWSYRQLHCQVNELAACMGSLGITRGDRIIIYMPMIAQAVAAMLACARIGAIHSVVFGGFAPQSLAARIDDARPALLITADAGMRGGKLICYKPLVDEAVTLARHPPRSVLVFDRGLDPEMPWQPGRDLDWADELKAHCGAETPVTWLESNEPSYILYTSGTTGKPKGVQRDTGGHGVALLTSMKYIFTGEPGETMFTTSDIGWVVGHSFMVYGPLLRGMTSILYEGLPVRPHPGIWWEIVQKYRVSVMFSSPTSMRILKKQDPKHMLACDTSSLRYLFLAGEPLDAPTSCWLESNLRVPVIDNYWQTETGWPILASFPGMGPLERRLGSPGRPAPGFQVRLAEAKQDDGGSMKKGVLALKPPLPPGCLSTVWGNDEAFVQTYFFNAADGQLAYSTFDWAAQDSDGFFFILGRSDDVINVAGHRLGTREIEEAISAHPDTAEVAVVGVSDELKGQAIVACVVLKSSCTPLGPEAEQAMIQALQEEVCRRLGPIARPSKIHFLSALPKTRSGKLLRRAIRALSEQRDPGDLTTLDDPAVMAQIKSVQTSTSGGRTAAKNNFSGPE